MSNRCVRCNAEFNLNYPIDDDFRQHCKCCADVLFRVNDRVSNILLGINEEKNIYETIKVRDGMLVVAVDNCAKVEVTNNEFI